jgi:DNA-binding PadR family transcriptional regulator
MREMLKWTRFANFSKLRETLETELDTDEKKIAYDDSDGANGLKELAALSHAPQDTIYSWWQRWFRLGLVTESETRKGRMKKIVSLDDVGLSATKTRVRAQPVKAKKASEANGEHEVR